MLKVMLRKQLIELVSPFVINKKTGKRKTPKQMIPYIILIIYVFGILVFNGFNNAKNIYGIFCSPAVSDTVVSSNDWIYFSLIFCLSTALGVILAIIVTYTSIFMSNDNDLLLSMPIPVSTIVISRLLNSFIWALIFTVPSLIPGYIIYAVNSGLTFRILIGGLFSIIISPVAAVDIAALIGWLIGIVTRKIAKKNGILTVLTLFFVGIYSFLNSYLIGSLSSMTQLEATRKLSPIFSSFRLFGNALNGDILSILIILVILGIITAAIYVVLMRSFIGIVTTKVSGKKKKFNEKMIISSSQSGALLKKEFRHFFGSAVYLTNTACGSFLSIIAAVAVLLIGDNIAELVEALDCDRLMLNVVVTAVIIGLASTNFVSAPSYTLEGKSFWIIKSMPVNYEAVLNSKVFLHLIVAGVPAVLLFLSASVFFYLDLRIIVASLLYIYSCGVIGLLFDLKWGSTMFINETVAVKQNMVALAVMGVNVLLGSLSCVPYFVLRNRIAVNEELYINSMWIFYALLSVVLCRKLKSTGVRLLDEAC